jgi:peptidoglycan/xylan/chitin deacetylase (PgdA/CDA1 family)
VVSLTFDAGSDLGETDRVLDVLAAEHITATFGITGRFAQDHPAVVARMAAAGHQLVNHTADHRSFTGFSTDTDPLTPAERAEQLRGAEASIEAATGGVGTAGWFRPPYGDLDGGVERDVAAAGWPTVLMWTVDSLGWKGLPADEVVDRCLQRAEPGAIYLFHVGSASTDADALPRIVGGLRAAGYSFAPAAQLPR